MKALIIIIITALALFSCKKEKIDLIMTNPQAQFNTPTTAGSYWIYHKLKIDTNGIETQYQEIDSVSIEGDTSINNLNYTVYKATTINANNSTAQYISYFYHRDSSGYIVDNKGMILYSYNNFNDTIEKGDDASWERRTKMFQNIPVTVPAGSFNSIEARRFYYSKVGGPANNCGDEYFTLGTMYVEGVGKVKESYGYVTQLQNCGDRMESRLVDYYIAP